MKLKKLQILEKRRRVSKSILLNRRTTIIQKTLRNLYRILTTRIYQRSFRGDTLTTGRGVNRRQKLNNRLEGRIQIKITKTKKSGKIYRIQQIRTIRGRILTELLLTLNLILSLNLIQLIQYTSTATQYLSGIQAQ